LKKNKFPPSFEHRTSGGEFLPSGLKSPSCTTNAANYLCCNKMIMAQIMRQKFTPLVVFERSQKIACFTSPRLVLKKENIFISCSHISRFQSSLQDRNKGGNRFPGQTNEDVYELLTQPVLIKYCIPAFG
jgi:hypothetical protein